MTCRCKCRADSRFAHSQWKTSLQGNVVSHWLGTNLESALKCHWRTSVSFLIRMCWHVHMSTKYFYIWKNTRHCSMCNLDRKEISGVGMLCSLNRVYTNDKTITCNLVVIFWISLKWSVAYCQYNSHIITCYQCYRVFKFEYCAVRHHSFLNHVTIKIISIC